MQVPALAALLAVLYGVWQWVKSRQRVFLLDFACYKPPENLKVDLDDFMKGSRESGVGINLSFLQTCAKPKKSWGALCKQAEPSNMPCYCQRRELVTHCLCQSGYM